MRRFRVGAPPGPDSGAVCCAIFVFNVSPVFSDFTARSLAIGLVFVPLFRLTISFSVQRKAASVFHFAFDYSRFVICSHAVSPARPLAAAAPPLFLFHLYSSCRATFVWPPIG